MAATVLAVAIVLGGCAGPETEPQPGSPGQTATASSRATAPPATIASTPIQPTATPVPTFEERVRTAYLQNVGYLPYALSSGLTVAWDPASGTLGLVLVPTNSDIPSNKDPARNRGRSLAGQLLDMTGQSAIVASRSVWSEFSEVQRLTVSVEFEVTDKFGAFSLASAANITVVRATGTQFQYDGLKRRAETDNKMFFCSADGYEIFPFFYVDLGYTGCLEEWGMTKHAP